MHTCLTFLKRQFWPLSALLCGPWSGALLLAAVSHVTAGSQTGTYILTHYATLRLGLVSLFSLYFVLAFMMWMVGRNAPATQSTDTAPEPVAVGLSTGQILCWGFLGMLLIPATVVLSTFGSQASIMTAVSHLFFFDASTSTGFLWLLSISVLIMTPIMVVWLVWMWRTWAAHRATQAGAEPWNYEYE